LSGCYLRISGRDLDGPSLADALRLPVEESWRRGDPRSATRAHRSGGLRLQVSAHDGDHVPAQIQDALAFLTLHRGILAELEGRGDVDSLLLDFSWNIPTGGTVQWNRWPPELCLLCGELGIAIEATAYVVATA
jgi:hypothetical protein